MLEKFIKGNYSQIGQDDVHNKLNDFTVTKFYWKLLPLILL